MRTIETNEITRHIKEMCIEANHYLSDDMQEIFKQSAQKEASPLGRQILQQLEENLEIAANERIPICQDTGMAVIFIKVGQEVHIQGGSLAEAIHQGVREGYTEGYLRKSVVKDPIYRENTKDNTPAVIHYEITEGDKVEITVAPKGFGSENMSRIFMLKPADGIRELEEEMLETINRLGIGPGGLGGVTTAMAVNIETYPTHIAGLPVAVNICCHVNRHVRRVI